MSRLTSLKKCQINVVNYSSDFVNMAEFHTITRVKFSDQQRSLENVELVGLCLCN